jgi:hypothetical protein
MPRQYYACAFGTSPKTYTYHFDGDDTFAPGDKVVVTTDRGPSVVTVVLAMDEAPKFPTKPIVGKDRPPQPVADEPVAETIPAPEFATEINPEDLF